MENKEFNIDEIITKKLLERETEKSNEQFTQQEKANAIVNIAKKPENMVRLAVSDKISNKILTDDTTKERIEKTADKIVDSSVMIIENEAQANGHKSEKEVIDTYFNQHKEELKTAGIDKPTYIEDMEKGVQCYRKWSNLHWKLFGWWQTGINTLITKARPFQLTLNILAVVISVGTLFLSVLYGIRLIKLIW